MMSRWKLCPLMALSLSSSIENKNKVFVALYMLQARSTVPRLTRVLCVPVQPVHGITVGEVAYDGIPARGTSAWDNKHHCTVSPHTALLQHSGCRPAAPMQCFRDGTGAAPEGSCHSIPEHCSIPGHCSFPAPCPSPAQSLGVEPAGPRTKRGGCSHGVGGQDPHRPFLRDHAGNVHQAPARVPPARVHLHPHNVP